MKTILVPVDGSRLAERALPYAGHLARTAGGRLLLLWASIAFEEATLSTAETTRAAEQCVG